MEKLEDDTCQLLISPRGLLPARRVAILFATRAARHISYQRGQSDVERQRVRCPMAAASADVHTWIQASSDVSATRQRSKTGFLTKFLFVIEKTF